MKYIFASIVFFLYLKLEARYVQVADFLCGCKYCEQVNTSEPLDIGMHMVRCHGWRGSMMKTVEVMNQLKQNPYDIPARDLLPNNEEDKSNNVHIRNTEQEEPLMSTIDDPYIEYEWIFTEENGWVYCNEEQADPASSTWVYSEDMGWIYKFSFSSEYIYSSECGWFYKDIYMDTKILYWYDRRMWLFPADFKKEYQE